MGFTTKPKHLEEQDTVKVTAHRFLRGKTSVSYTSPLVHCHHSKFPSSSPKILQL